MKGKRLCFFCLRHNANYREFNANFRKLIQFMQRYNPEIEDELLKPLEIMDETNILVLCTITVPKEIEKMSVNLMAPIIISGETRKANQIIVDQEGYEVKFPIYEILKAAKERAGE